MNWKFKNIIFKSLYPKETLYAFKFNKLTFFYTVVAKHYLEFSAQFNPLVQDAQNGKYHLLTDISIKQSLI